MAFINKHDTNGTKGLLAKGELGYDDYIVGGDTGRVYVGTSTENIPLAKRLEANTMTKAEFNALAEERKANRAGSGFDEFGWSRLSWTTINEGLGVQANNPNLVYLGDSPTIPSKIAGQVSKTSYPITLINGVVQKLMYSGNESYNYIQLPTAPTIYPHDTVLTPEQIASGVIKHADASNSGLIVNGKFDTDTSGWAAVNGSALNIVSGVLRVTNSVGFDYGGARQALQTVAGKKYILEVQCYAGTSNARVDVFNQALTATLGTTGTITSATITRYSLEFTATATVTHIDLKSDTTSDGVYSCYDNIAVYPADAISRSDLVFLESWHEDISEKNFVYPLGNIQYLGGNTDGLTGIANGAFTGFETYSLFGNWQTPSSLIGKGYVWSSLTEAQKRAFIANSENNCYLDGDKVIQVRYRLRVRMGENSNSMGRATVQGKAVVPSTVLFTSPVTTVDAGLYSNTSATYTYTGTSTNAISIATVGRRNQGMYHNVYNPNGTKVASDGLDCFRTAVSFTSISDCFDPAKLLTASGNIGSVSGRPDGLFYDQVHEGDIQDLRNSSKKVEDYNRLIGREFNKLVAGTYRGKEGEIESIIMRTFTKASAFGMNNNRFYFGITGTSYPEISLLPEYDLEFTLVGSNGSVYNTKQVINNANAGRMYIPLAGNTEVYIPIDGKNTNVSMDTLFPNGTTITVIVSKRTTRTKSNKLLHCDIIGNPINYPTAWKESGVFGTPLIVAEDGTSLLLNGTLDTFKLSRKANATPLLCLRSIDNGATWVSFTPVFSTTTNAITLTDEPASNLVIVYYQTKTTMATPTVNSEVLELGEVLGTNGLANGALVSTLIGKVPTANTAPYSQRGYGVSGYRIDMSTFKFSTTSTELPVHSALSLAGGAIGIPAVKVLPYLTRKNGKAYLNLVFKEMKHNGTSWGDDAKFNIVDNVSATTDNNAQTVLIGQKTVELPYFIGADE